MYLAEMFSELRYNRHTVSIRLTIEPHFGLPMVKYIYVDTVEFTEFLDRVAGSENFADLYFPDMENLRYSGSMPTIVHQCGRTETELSTAEMDALVEKLRSSYDGVEYFQRSTTDYIEFYGRNIITDRYYNIRMPYYDAENTQFEEFLTEVESVIVVNNENGEITEYTTPSEIRAICENLCIFRGGTSSPYTHLEPSYSVAVNLGDWDAYERGLSTFFAAAFLEGRVPAFIG